MKRREFILNTALALGGTVVLASGCGKKDVIKKEGEVVKRRFHSC